MIYISSEDYIEIFYVNYKNEEYTQKYKITHNMMIVNESDDEIFINVKQNDDVILTAQEIFEYVEKWNNILNF